MNYQINFWYFKSLLSHDQVSVNTVWERKCLSARLICLSFPENIKLTCHGSLVCRQVVTFSINTTLKLTWHNCNSNQSSDNSNSLTNSVAWSFLGCLFLHLTLYWQRRRNCHVWPLQLWNQSPNHYLHNHDFIFIISDKMTCDTTLMA